MANKKTYKELRAELDELLQWFEGEDVNIEQAIAKHTQASKLIKQLEDYLQEAELKVSKAD